MKLIKVSLTLLIPSLLAGITFCSLMALRSHFAWGYSHDLYENHSRAALIPFIALISVLFAFIPSLFYVADLIWKPRTIASVQAEPVTEMLTSSPVMSVGQVFTSAGSNCRVRIKAVKLHQALNIIEASNDLLFDYL